jgi:hypothetical protein
VIRYWLGEQAIDGGDESKCGKKPDWLSGRKGGSKPFEARGAGDEAGFNPDPMANRKGGSKPFEARGGADARRAAQEA